MLGPKRLWPKALNVVWILLLGHTFSSQSQLSSSTTDFKPLCRTLQSTAGNPSQKTVAKIYPGYFCMLPDLTLPGSTGNSTLSDIYVSLETESTQWQVENTSLSIDSKLGKISDIRVKYTPEDPSSLMTKSNRVHITGQWRQSELDQVIKTDTYLPLVVATDLEFIRRKPGEEQFQLHWGETLSALPLMKLDVECEGFSDGLLVKTLSRPVELEYAKLYFDNGVLYMSGALPSLPNTRHRSSSSSSKYVLLAFTVSHRTENLKSSEISIKFEITNAESGFSSSDLFLAAVLFGFICLLVTLIILLTKEGENNKNTVQDAINPGLSSSQTQDNNMLSKSVIDWTKGDTSASKVDQTVVDELYMFKDAQYKEQRKRRSLFQADDNRPSELQIPQVNINDPNLSQIDSAFKQPNLSMNSSFMKQTLDLSPIRGALPPALDLHLETPQRTPLDAGKIFKSPIPLDSESPADKDPNYPYITPDNRGKVQERYRHSKTITEFDSRLPPGQPQADLQKATLHTKSDFTLLPFGHAPTTPEPKYAQLQRQASPPTTAKNPQEKPKLARRDKQQVAGKLALSPHPGQLSTILSGATRSADTHSAETQHSAASVLGERMHGPGEAVVVVSRYEFPSGTAESGEGQLGARK